MHSSQRPSELLAAYRVKDPWNVMSVRSFNVLMSDTCGACVAAAPAVAEAANLMVMGGVKINVLMKSDHKDLITHAYRLIKTEPFQDFDGNVVTPFNKQDPRYAEACIAEEQQWNEDERELYGVLATWLTRRLKNGVPSFWINTDDGNCLTLEGKPEAANFTNVVLKLMRPNDVIQRSSNMYYLDMMQQTIMGGGKGKQKEQEGVEMTEMKEEDPTQAKGKNKQPQAKQQAQGTEAQGQEKQGEEGEQPAQTPTPAQDQPQTEAAQGAEAQGQKEAQVPAPAQDQAQAEAAQGAEAQGQEKQGEEGAQPSPAPAPAPAQDQDQAQAEGTQAAQESQEANNAQGTNAQDTNNPAQAPAQEQAEGTQAPQGTQGNPAQGQVQIPVSQMQTQAAPVQGQTQGTLPANPANQGSPQPQGQVQVAPSVAVPAPAQAPVPGFPLPKSQQPPAASGTPEYDLKVSTPQQTQQGGFQTQCTIIRKGTPDQEIGTAVLTREAESDNVQVDSIQFTNPAANEDPEVLAHALNAILNKLHHKDSKDRLVMKVKYSTKTPREKLKALLNNIGFEEDGDKVSFPLGRQPGHVAGAISQAQ